jgi:transposase InsO family protein
MSVDFIVKLPESERKDAVMVVVDSVTKQAHFVDTVTTLSTVETAKLYVQYIWKHHGLPGKALSDRGPQFITEFMKELYRLLGIKLAATTTYHPQGNGQIERVNQELEQYLHLFIIKDKMTGSDFFRLQNSSMTIIYTPQLLQLFSNFVPYFTFIIHFFLFPTLLT